jgi:hypothetical protein
MTVSPSAAALTADAIPDPPMYPGDAHELPAPTVPVAPTKSVVTTANAGLALISDMRSPKTNKGRIKIFLTTEPYSRRQKISFEA